MLFPGAIYFIIPITFVVLLVICIAAGLVFAVITYWVAGFFINRSATWNNIQRGENIKWPWWVHKQKWFGLGWFWGALLVFYVNCGPWWALMKYLGGI